jgi:hypothetical protein
MARDVPGSVVNSMRVLGLIVATSGVITLLTWLMHDEVVWAAAGHPAAVFSSTYEELVQMTGAVEVEVGPEPEAG